MNSQVHSSVQHCSNLFRVNPVGWEPETKCRPCWKGSHSPCSLRAPWDPHHKIDDVTWRWMRAAVCDVLLQWPRYRKGMNGCLVFLVHGFQFAIFLLICIFRKLIGYARLSQRTSFLCRWSDVLLPLHAPQKHSTSHLCSCYCNIEPFRYSGHKKALNTFNIVFVYVFPCPEMSCKCLRSKTPSWKRVIPGAFVKT